MISDIVVSGYKLTGQFLVLPWLVGWLTEALVLISILEENKLVIIRCHVFLKTSENSNSNKLILLVSLSDSLVRIPNCLLLNITNSCFSA